MASVIQYAGYYVKLRYLGYEDDTSEDFWMHMDDPDVQPIGWCADNGFAIVPPYKIAHRVDDWFDYLTKRTAGVKTLNDDFHKLV